MPLVIHDAYLPTFRFQRSPSKRHIEFRRYSTRPLQKLEDFRQGENPVEDSHSAFRENEARVLDSCLQKEIKEEGIWVKLEWRLKGYPPRPKVARTKLQFFKRSQLKIRLEVPLFSLLSFSSFFLQQTRLSYKHAQRLEVY